MTNKKRAVAEVLSRAIMIKRRDELLQGITQIYNLDDVLIIIVKPNGRVEIVDII